MRIHMPASIAALALILMLGVPNMLLHAQPKDVRSPALEYKPERAFEDFLAKRFQGFESSRELNFSGSVSASAIPLQKTPISDVKELEGKKTTIGGLYLPTGSIRLKLGPGAYRVELLRESSAWKVRFIDEKGESRGEALALVSSAPPVPVPLASVESSVCYRFDNTVVCI